MEGSSVDITFTAASSSYIGSYSANTYPSPLAIHYPAGAAASADLKFAFPQTVDGHYHTNWWPQYQYPGSIGKFTYFPRTEGPFDFGSTLTSEIDSAMLMSGFKIVQTKFDKYKEDKEDYDKKRDLYDK